jgi:predicted membrane channel-forming protein YqfA (hemolysin III family)
MKFNLLKHLSQEEKLNTISHAIGILVGLIALPILLLKNKNNDVLSNLSLWIYGFSFIMLYTASTVYHYLTNPNKKKLARKFADICFLENMKNSNVPKWQRYVYFYVVRIFAKKWWTN